ncbi:MAG: hypothetical protein HOP32_01035 [Nitrospira sp.]|nr:hypothetical protein [Nitrospira sp.]
MRRRMAAFMVWLLLALSAPVGSAMATGVTLHIPPVFQERPSWSWAAVGEMVFKYYYVPAVHRIDYQCGIVQEQKLCMGTPNCTDCDLPAGDATSMFRLLEQYPGMASKSSKAGPIALTAQLKGGSLSEAEVKKEIDEGRPIIAEVAPSGFKINGISHHMALIVGYNDSSGNLMLTVNDPFPFEDDRFLWIANPYQPNMDMSGENTGQYEISFERFRSKIKWKQTMYRISCTGHDCPSDSHQVADGAVAKDDSEALQAVLMASSGEFKALRTGHKAVDGTGTTWRSTVSFADAKQCLVRDKDDSDGARWSCLFKFSDRSEADNAAEDIVKRLHKSLPNGWVGTDLNVDSDSELYTKTDKFSATKPGTDTAISLYFIDVKMSGRVSMYLSVQSPLPIHP